MWSIVRAIAGFVIPAGLTLVMTHHKNWLLLTRFEGLNLLQSAFTNLVPRMSILRHFGVKQV